MHCESQADIAKVKTRPRWTLGHSEVFREEPSRYKVTTSNHIVLKGTTPELVSQQHVSKGGVKHP